MAIVLIAPSTPSGNTLESIRRGVQRKLAGETPWGDIYATVASVTDSDTIVLNGLTSSFLSDNHFQGWYLYNCDSTADAGAGWPPGLWRRVAAYDASAGSIDLDAAMTKTGGSYIAASNEVELTPYHPKLVEKCINEFLQQTYYPCEWAISLANIENNDFEHTTISTGFTDTNNILAAETSTVFRQVQSGATTATAADQEISIDAIPVVGQEGFRLWVACKCTTDDTAKAVLYDDTSTADITSIDAEELRWQLLTAEGQAPSTCESVSIKLQPQASGDIIYWDDIQLISTRRTEYKLPSWITEEYQVQDVVVYKGAGQLADDSYNYMPDEAHVSRWPHWKLIRDGSSFRLKLHAPFGAGRPRLRALRPYSTLTTSSASVPTGSATTCDLDFAIQGGFVTMLERLAGTVPGEEREEYRDWFLKEKTKLDRMRADFQPWARKPKRDIQGEGLFGLSEAH